VTNLVANSSGNATTTDPHLVNAWGLSRSATGAWWISDQGTGLSTLYDGTGTITPLVVTIPPADPKAGTVGSPSGTIFNGTSEFAVAAGKPAVFLFCTLDGTISGWNPTVQSNAAIITVNQKQQSVFTGMTMAEARANGSKAQFLYVADFKQAKLQVFDSNFQHVAKLEKAFAAIPVPSGYAPFNVQNIGGNLYVTLAEQGGPGGQEVDGPGLGIVAVLSPEGTLLQVLEEGRWFNAPWGVALAPSDFGAYSHDLLVGNLGDGTVHVFDPITGKHIGVLRDASNKAIKLDGLWALSFGSGLGSSGPATSLYFTAGPDDDQNGLFGAITPIQNTVGNNQ
jgi:uncharacterized protein (TIGR03118 family)